MSAHEGLPHLRELILFLCLSGVLIPLLQRRSINPVLGFLAVGTLVGPYGLGRLVEHWPWLATVTFARVEDVAVFAELGVIFLMFMIGLEMSVDRLWALRRWVFGVGALQVSLSAAAIGGLAYVFGNPVEASVILGLVLAFSSTAVVMQLLTLRRELGTPLGQASFSLLLFQDLAVVPLLVLVGLLGQHGDGSFALQIGQAPFGGTAGRVDAGARNDHGAQVGHQVGEMAVAGGPRHFHVELEVGVHSVGGVGDRQGERGQCAFEIAQVGVFAPQGGQTGRFGLQADAQLQQRDHIGHGGKVLGGDAEGGRFLGRFHEGADAVARFHQPRRLQARNGFAHHGAAHIKPFDQRRFGGQFVAGFEHAIADVAAQRGHDFRHQPALPPGRPGLTGFRTWGFH